MQKHAIKQAGERQVPQCGKHASDISKHLQHSSNERATPLHSETYGAALDLFLWMIEHKENA